MKQIVLNSAFYILVLTLTASLCMAQGTEFTYQGNLVEGTSPANGNYDFEFALFDSVSGGAQFGATISKNNVAVAGGNFSVILDFGSQFPGAARFIEIRVRQAGQPGITVLAPRQAISSQPYSVKSINAETAANATNAATAVNALQLGGIAAGQFVLTGDARLSDSRNPLPGSTNYIQNGTSQQASSNFNVSGTGTADILNAGTQFNIGGQRVFTTPTNIGSNLFIGKSAGATLTGGNANTFVGTGAGTSNISGSSNSYFGVGAGGANLTSSFNSIFGHSAGSLSTGGSNSFFGTSSGQQNDTGSSNSFFGYTSGFQNGTGFVNSFFGVGAGFLNTSGNGNTAIGANADFAASNLQNATAVGRRAISGCSNCLVLGAVNGINNATADTNVGIGVTQPTQRLHVVGNSLFTGNLTVSGTLNATLPIDNVNYIRNQTAGPQASSNFFISGNGTANGTIGASIINAQSQYNLEARRIIKGDQNPRNFFVGYDAGTANTSGDFNAFFGAISGAANTSGSLNSFFGANAGFTNTTGSFNSAMGTQVLGQNTSGGSNSAFGTHAGSANTTGSGNVFVGSTAGNSNTTGSFNTIVGRDADVGTANLTNATAIGALAQVNQSNSLVLGSIVGVNGSSFDTNVGIGTTTPGHKLTIGSIVGNPPVTTSAKLAVFSSGVDASYAIFRHISTGVETIVGADSTITDGTTGSAIFGTATNHGVLFKTNGITRMTITPSGIVGISSLGLAGTTALCRNAQNLIGNCSSSARYKNNIRSFSPGIDLIRKLRPVTFNWNEGGMHDLGLVAEEVAEIEPLLTTTNEKGEVEGVKYDRIGVVLVNALKEQQIQIDKLDEQISSQKAMIEKQQTEIGLLKVIVCGMKEGASSPICRSNP